MPPVRSAIAERELGRRLDPGRESHELGDLVLRQPAQPDPRDALGAVHVDERLGERRRDVGVGVAKGRDQQHPGGRAGPHEVTQELERRGIGPVHVLEHDEERCLRADPDEQVGDRGVEPVPLGVGIGRDRPGEGADARLELREQSRQLAAGRTEMPSEHLGLRVADEVLEGGRERAVRRPDDGVAVAVEHGRALLGHVARKLPHEAALARAGIAGDERRAAPLPGGAGQKGSQRRKLVRPPRECERRREPERARERYRRRCLHPMIRSDHCAPQAAAKVGQARS